MSIARILTVCTGNICRSPAAEHLLRQRLEELSGWQGCVSSAGTAALVNFPSDETVRELMQARGLDLTAHRAAQITVEQLRWADMVLVMEKYHRQQICKIDPTARGKTFLLGHWTNAEIPDPYQRGEGVHAETLNLIAKATDLWAKRLAAIGPERRRRAHDCLGAQP